MRGGGKRSSRDLAGLALAIEERTAQAEIAFIADGGAGVPEFRRADLVGRVLDHAGDLPVLDLVVQLAAELRVVALLVDRIRPAAMDVDAVLHVLDHVLDAEWLFARRQRDIGHALELHAGPGIGIAAAVRRIAAEDMGFIAGGLVVDQDAVAHQVPALGLHPFIVVADRTEAARLGLVGEEGDNVAAPAEAGIALVQRGEAGAGVVGFVAEHAVQLQRVADVLVDGQEQVGRVQHQVVLAGLHRRRLQFLARVAGGGDGVFDRVVGIAVGGDAAGQLHLAARIAIQELVAHAHRRGQAGAGAELAAGLVDGGGGERQPDAMDVLVDERTVAGGEVLLFVDQEQGGIDVVGARIQRGGVERQQQLDLVLDRHRHRVPADRRLPADLTHRRRRRQLHRPGLDAGVGAGDRRRLLDRSAHGGLGLLMGCSEAPGAVDDHPHAHAGRFAVGHVADLVFAGDDRLVEIAADADIAVAGLGGARGGERHVRQAPALGGIDRCEQLLGGDGTGMRQQQARQAQTGKSQELTSLHSVSLSRLRAVGNGPDRSRQLLDFRQRGASGQVTAVMVGGGFGRASSPAPA